MALAAIARDGGADPELLALTVVRQWIRIVATGGSHF